MAEEGGYEFEGVFKNGTSEYAGQGRRDHSNMAHGKGVMHKGNGWILSGDWKETVLWGYGEMFASSEAITRGQYERSWPHGYAEKFSCNGKYQGLFETATGMHGPIRHTALDGSVKDTLWEKGKDTGVPCNADDAAEKAEEGMHVSMK